MRAATGGPRSHKTPSRSRPQSTSTRLPTGCDTTPLPDRSGSPKMRMHRFARVPRIESATGHSPVGAQRSGAGTAPRRPEAPCRWLLGAVPRCYTSTAATPRLPGHPRSCHTPWLRFEHMCADGLLQGLNEAQRRAVTADASALCILAGAGSGKTRVLTRRIAWRVAQGGADPRHVLALTFTRKAAGELSSRLSALGVRDQVAAGTFHAIAYAQLRRRWADRGERAPALVDRKVRLLAPLLAGHRSATVQPADVATEIEWAKARFVAPADYEVEAGRAGRKP